jgi:hypothetical protein
MRNREDENICRVMIWLSAFSASERWHIFLSSYFIVTYVISNVLVSMLYALNKCSQSFLM